MKVILNTLLSFWKISIKTGVANLPLFLTFFLYWKLIGKRIFRFKFKYKNNNFHFYADSRVDLAAVEEIFVHEEYMYDYIPNPKVILDLGANVGDTAIFYSILFPAAKIFAIEPNPLVHEKLELNAGQFTNIKVCKCAVSDKTGKIDLHFGDSHLGSSINQREQNRNSVEVDVYSLDDFCKNEGIEKIDILKFDIEGAEEYLLKSDYLKTRVVEMVGEMHDDLVSQPLQPMIDKLGLENINKKILNNKRYIIYGKLTPKL